MTKPTYADECLARAEKATEGPWGVNNVSISADKGKRSIAIVTTPVDMTQPVDGHGIGVEDYTLHGVASINAEFIAHSRTDIVELATRLKRACEAMRGIYGLNLLADELERPL